jgi:release factor glutamine methyltransferase
MTLAAARAHALQELTKTIEKEEAQAMALELVLHLAGIDKKDWARQQHILLKDEALNKLDQSVQRIVKGEPLQYVTGEAWFLGLRLTVTPAVLIPRPETEELVDWIISHCQFPIEKLPILEIGTGSGCIALALQKRLRKATVTAIEYSEEALAIAEKNSRDSGIYPVLMQGDLFNEQQWAAWPEFSMLISNPPYIPLEEKSAMENRVANHEPALALFVSNEDPLCYYRSLGKLLLNKGLPGAQLFCEMNARLAQDTALLLKSMGLQTEIKLDMQGKERVIRAWR